MQTYPLYIETLEKLRPIVGSERFTYKLRAYQSATDVLGVDLYFMGLTKQQFNRVKKLRKFKLAENRRKTSKSIRNYLSKSIYKREFHALKNAVKLSKAIRPTDNRIDLFGREYKPKDLLKVSQETFKSWLNK